jgi:autotransporter-associated beta strand protein
MNYLNALPNGSGQGNVVLNGGTTAGILDLNNFDTAINGLNGTAGAALGQVVNNGSAAAKTLTVGNGNANGTFAGLIADHTSGTGTIALTKTGTGTQTLSGANTYTGATTVNGGMLLVNGALGTGSVTVAANAALGGSGSIGGATMVQSGGTIQAGNAAGAGTLTIGTLNLGDSTSAATGSHFSIASGGKISATTLNVTGTNTITILDASLTSGTNTLITYTGTIGGSGFAGLRLGALSAGTAAYLTNNGSAVQLVVLVSPVFAGKPAFGAGGFSLSFSGSSGQNYRLLASTNLSLPLTIWTMVASGTFGAGVVNFTDSAATNGQKFYRIASP